MNSPWIKYLYQILVCLYISEEEYQEGDIIRDENDFRYGVFRIPTEQQLWLDMTHVKRIKSNNQEGEKLQIILTSKSHYSKLKLQDDEQLKKLTVLLEVEVLEVSEVTVPQQMIYVKETFTHLNVQNDSLLQILLEFEKYKHLWPLNFNSQPPGYQLASDLTDIYKTKLEDIVRNRLFQRESPNTFIESQQNQFPYKDIENQEEAKKVIGYRDRRAKRLGLDDFDQFDQDQHLIAQADIQHIQDSPRKKQCQKGSCILTDKDFNSLSTSSILIINHLILNELAFIESKDQLDCIIDHPIMKLAEKQGEILLSKEISSVGSKRPSLNDQQYFMKDLYLISSVEPCFMCAMALVHSRISRVYFVEGRTEDGGLVSNGVQIGCLRNLNHQYLSFQISFQSSHQTSDGYIQYTINELKDLSQVINTYYYVIKITSCCSHFLSQCAIYDRDDNQQNFNC